MRAETPIRAERLLFALPLGLGVIAYGVLGLGLAGFLSLGPILIFLGLLALIALWQPRRVFGLPSAQAATQVSPSDSSSLPPFVAESAALSKSILIWRILGLGCGLFIVFFLLVGVLAPPSVNEWDTLSYHLAAPKIYLKHHSIHYIPFIHHSNFPFTLEMLYTIGLLLGGAALAKSFHLLCAVLTALALYLFGRRFFSEQAGILGAMAFLAIPNVGWEATIAYIDLGTALFTFLSVYALIIWQEGKQKPWLVVSGIFMGLALATKMFALATLFLSAVWVCIIAWRTKLSLQASAQSLALFVLPALLVASPWYLKSYLMTGNPVYPFYYSIFGGRNWSLENAIAYRQEQLKFGLGRDLPSLLLLPWNLLVNSSRFFDSPVVFATIGPLPLGFFWIIVFSKELNYLQKAMLCYGGAFLLFWFVQMQQVRYLLVILPFLLAAGAHSLIANWPGYRYIKIPVAGFAAAGILFGMYVAFAVNRTMLPVAFGAESKDAYLARTLDIYDTIKTVNSLPETAKIIFFHEARGFYCDREYFWGNPGHHMVIPYSTFRSAKAMFDYFKQMGFTHLLINEKFAPKDSHEQWQIYLMEAPSLGLMTKRYESKGVSLYEIR